MAIRALKLSFIFLAAFALSCFVTYWLLAPRAWGRLTLNEACARVRSGMPQAEAIALIEREAKPRGASLEGDVAKFYSSDEGCAVSFEKGQVKEARITGSFITF